MVGSGAFNEMSNRWFAESDNLDALTLVCPTSKSVGFPDTHRGDWNVGRGTSIIIRKDDIEVMNYNYVGIQVLSSKSFKYIPETRFRTHKLWYQSLTKDNVLH